MAFVPNNMAKVATSGLGSLFVYKDDNSSTGQLKATIIAANFFSDKRIISQLKVGDVILVLAKDYSTLVKVATLNITAGTVTVTQFNLT